MNSKEKTMNKIKRRKITQLSILFFGFLLMFISGAFHKDTTFERVGEYITNVVVDNTRSKKYCAVAIDAKNKAGDYYGNEFSNLFDVFRSGVVTYTSAMNVNKEEDITFCEYKTMPLSFVFLGPIGTMQIKNENDEIVGYRHYKYNFNMLFEDATYNGSEFDKSHMPVIYLSKSQADGILESRGIPIGADAKYAVSDYKSLLQKTVDLNFGGDFCKYVIWNIYCDDSDNNFYFSGIKEVLGEFVLTSYYQPSAHDLRENHKSLYFFNEYSYYNQYLMRYLNERLSDEKPAAAIVKNNIINEIDDNYFLSFYLNESIGNVEWVYYVLLIIAFGLIGSSVCLYFVNKDLSAFFILLNILISLVPYLIFKLVYIITNDVVFFSQPSVKVAAISNVIFIFILLLVPIYKSFILKSTRVDYYELDV